MEKGRLFLIVFSTLLGGYIGYVFAGLNGVLPVAIVGALLMLYITSASFQEMERRRRQERREARDLRRRAYHSELGRQEAVGDYAEGQRRKAETRKYLKQVVRRAGY